MSEKLSVAGQGDRELVMTRTFLAPASLVFDAWTKPEMLRQWMGPRGWSLTICDVDLRVGGRYRFEGPGCGDGSMMGWGGVYREIVPGKRLVATERFDQAWYPGEALLTLTLDERGGRTLATTTILYATAEGRDMVLASPMEQGVSQGYEQLDELLASRLDRAA